MTQVAEPVPPAPPVRRRSRARLLVGLAVVLAALGFLVFQGLGNATVYFRTADEAVAERERLGTRRFRIEGTVVPGSVRDLPDAVAFDIESNAVTVPVRHDGNTPTMFRPGIPVVLEGRFDGDVFASDRVMVKHSETYRAKHPDRTADYEPTGQ